MTIVVAFVLALFSLICLMVAVGLIVGLFTNLNPEDKKHDALFMAICIAMAMVPMWAFLLTLKRKGFL